MSAQSPTVAANAPSPNNELAMLMQGYSPQTAVAAQRSQYLAQALAAMRDQGQTIRTPVALGSDLLAQALLQRKYGQSMQNFSQSAGGDMQRMAAPDDAWLAQQGGSQQPPAAPAASSLAPAAPPPPPPPTPQNTTPPPADAGLNPRGLRNNNPLNVTTLPNGQAWNGQTGADGQYATFGDPAAGWHAADTNLNSYVTRHGLNTVSGIVSRWAPAAGGNNPAAYAATVAAKLGVDPNQPLDLSTPDKRAPLLRAMAGVELGQPYGGPPAPVGMSPGRAQTPGGAPAYAPQGQPGPLQVSSAPQGTPTPPPSPAAGQPPAAGGNAGAPPAAASPAAGGASAPAFFHQPVAPEEIAYAESLRRNPRTFQEYLSYVDQLRQRTAAPVKPEMSVSREGQVLSANPWDPTHPNPAANIPGWRGPLPAGYDRGPNGEAVPTAAVKYGPVGQIPGTNQLGQTGPDGQLHAGPQLEFGPQQRVQLSKELSGQLTSSPEYQKFTEARSALQGFRSMVQAMAGANNGILDSAAMDSYLRGINPGASAKNTTVQMVMEHLGLPQEVQSAVLSATGNGYLTPQTLQQMDQAMVAYTAAHAAEAQRIHQNHLAIASQAGIDEKGLGENIGDIPQPMTLHFGGAPSPAQAGASARQTFGTAGASIGNAAANLPMLTPQQAAQAPRGTRFRSADGRIMVKS